MAEFDTAHEVDLREYLRVLRRRLPVIVLTFVVLVAAAVGYSLLQTKVYSASAQVLVPQTSALSQVNSQNNTPQANAQAAQRAMENEVRFAKGDAVKTAADKALERDAKIRVKSDTNDDVLTLTSHNTNRKEAARTANTFARAYIDERRKANVANYTTIVNALNGKVAALKSQQAVLPPNSAQFQALQSQIDELTGSQSSLLAAAQVAGQQGATLLDRADVPSTPVSPKVMRNALLAAALGLVLGVGLAFVFDRLDESIKSKSDLEEASAGLPVLGLIPQVSGWRNQKEAHVVSLESSRSPTAESYRTLRTSVQFLGIEEPLRVIAVTSSDAAEGKTTTLANLAVSFANTGQRVVMMCCDLRKPRIHTFFGKSNQVGFTSVLLGETSLDEALQPIEEQPRLSLLASGPLPPNPAELLTLGRVEQVIQSLAEAADIVLIDCPPVLPVADTLVLSKQVDGVIVVSEARTTGRRELHRSLELLAQVEAPVIGTVLNSVPSRGGYDYGYGGYRYGYDGYGYAAAPATNGKVGADGAEAAEVDVSANGERDEKPTKSRRRRRKEFERVMGETPAAADAPDVADAPED